MPIAPKRQTLSEILDDASDDEKLTVLIHGVVEIDGREDLTRDLLMNGYLVSTDDFRNESQDESINETENFDNELNKVQAMIADIGIAAEHTARVDHMHRASIFEVLRASKPVSEVPSLVTLEVETSGKLPDVSTSNQIKRLPRVYGPKAHHRIVLKEREESSMSRPRQIKRPLVVQMVQAAVHNILKGSMVLSNSTSESF
jgi:hypothetical protein